MRRDRPVPDADGSKAVDEHLAIGAISIANDMVALLASRRLR
jgi:hypothetical protein